MDLEAGFLAVMGVKAAGIPAEAGGLEELPSDNEAVPLPNRAANGSRYCWLTRRRSARA